MAKFSLKNKMMIILPVISLLFGIPVISFLYAKQPGHTAIDTHAEREHLHNVVEAARLSVKNTQELAKKFFNLTDNNSIESFIRAFEVELNTVDTQLLAQLEKQINSKELHSPEYIEIVKRSYKLLKDLRDNVAILLNALSKDIKPSNALNLVKPLQQAQSNITPRIENILKEFEELYTLVTAYDSTIAQNIEQFMSEFNKSIKDQPGKAEALKGLIHRVKCSK